nr:putative reverse transcriptase domain-containing protein [Tanacetum cinerariifolium]
GDQTSPPRDESSDSDFEAGVEPEVKEASDEPEADGADVKLEAEEPHGAPEATIGTEALRRHERIREAESETSRTEVSLLGSEAKIGKMEREILHHDLSGVEETLGKVVERLKVLESEENATLRKNLAEKEVLLDLTRMERDRAEKRIMPPKPMSEAHMREIIRDQFATSMNEFMANMNSGAGGSGGASGSGGVGGSGGTGGNADGTGVRGVGPTVPELTGCTYATFITCDPLPFNGTEAVVGLCQWFKKLESVFQISDCKEKDRVKFAMVTLRRRALTWWNERTKAMAIEATNSTPLSEVRKWMTEEFCPRSVIQRMEQELYNLRMKGMDIDGYTNRFHELALLCLRMVEPEAVKVEQYLRGLTKSIRGDVTSSQPATINDAVRLAYQLARQLIQDKTDEATEGEKRKGEGDRGSRGDNRREHNLRQNQRRVIELRSFDVIDGMDWLSKNDAAMLCGEKKVRIPLKNKSLIIEGDINQSRLKIISCIKARKYIENGCELFLAQVTGTVSKEKRVEDVPVIRNFPEVFPEDLPGRPPPRQVEFRIDLVPGATHVARAPYRLAPYELKELSEQLKELSEKCFIRSSSSPWGAPVLFVK